MFVIYFDDLIIYELNGYNNHLYKHMIKYEDFDEAKEVLVDYWETAASTAKVNIEQAKKMKLNK